MTKGNDNVLIEGRKKLLRDFCDTCMQPIGLEGCGTTFRSILEPIHCPPELMETHVICQFCLDVRPRSQDHSGYCAFAQRQLQLHAGGWSTILSNQVLQSMRHSTFLYFNPLVNLLHNLLVDLNVKDAVIVPVPIGSMGRTGRWVEIVRASSVGIGNVEVIPLLERKKQQSTRSSVAQVRERIVRREYEVGEGAGERVTDRTIILLDDNVTTGKTLTHCATLLQQLRPREIIPLVVERQISIRVLQRCASDSVDACPFRVLKNEDL